MLFGIPLIIGSFFTSILVIWMLISNRYRKLEKWIIGFVALIGLSFIIELIIVKFQWYEALKNCFVPSFPLGSIPIIMSVLGAIVMPHNLFLHSEIIQSRQWNLQDKQIIRRQSKFEFTDTLTAMIVGWAINSAMIIVAASVFHSHGITVTELSQAEATLKPLAGNASAIIFALALIFAGFSSSITAAMAGGSIYSGIFQEPFDISDNHSRIGIMITTLGALLIIFFIRDPFQGVIWSQIALSIQLPWTIFALISLTSSSKVMGDFSNSKSNKLSLWFIAAIVSFLNVMLLIQII